MTRGKHAASANRRRAETAEAQLDRLMPQLVDAQRTAKRYQSEAEQAPVLRRQLAALRESGGMPKAEHTRLMLEAEDRHRAELDRLEGAYAELIQMLTHIGALAEPEGDSWMSVRNVDALRAVQRPVALDILHLFGFERDFARDLLNNANGMRGKMHDEGLRDARNLMRMAKEAGLSGIPSHLVTGGPITMQSVLDGTSVVKPEDQPE